MRKYIVLASIMAFLVILVLPLHAAIEQGLLLYFSFDEAAGDTVIDLSSGRHNGTLSGGAEIINDIVKIGTGAVNIGVADASMEVASFAELAEYKDNSFLFWLYFTEGFNGNWSQVIAKVGPADRSPGIWINHGNTGFHYRYNPGNVGFDAIGPTGEGSVYDLEQWYHIAGIKEGEELRFYVNGELQETIAVPAEHDQGTGSLFVGKSSFRAATFIMDDLMVYDRGLTEAEILSVAGGGLTTPVEAAGKLASTWGGVKNRY